MNPVLSADGLVTPVTSHDLSQHIEFEVIGIFSRLRQESEPPAAGGHMATPLQPSPSNPYAKFRTHNKQ